MKLPRRHFLHLAASAAALPATVRIARAQTYPTRPVHLIEGFGAGGAPDIVARLIGQALSERLGQSFVVENRAGASSNIATEAVVRAPPDGYTLLLITIAKSIGYIRAGNLRGLAVTTTTRSQILPEVPVLSETLPGYEASAWFGIGAPKNTPGKSSDGSRGHALRDDADALRLDGRRR
jgi:tripartite-type tricarboxylate transporter receptor subunit TctC